MPASPTAYPLDAPTISGTTITVDELLNEPERITRDIADLAMQRFYMDKIFNAGGGVKGGSLIYELPNPQATDMYPNREGKEVAPGQGFPIIGFDRGIPSLARPRKFGAKWFVTKEAVKRNDPSALRNNMIRTSNMIRRRIENLGLAEIAAVVTANSRFRNGTSWNTFAGTAVQSRTGTSGPVADIMAALAQGDTEERGVEYDSVILHPNQAMSAKQAFPGQTLRQIFSQADDPEEDNQGGIRNIYVTPRATAGVATLFESGAVGDWRNEFPLEEETEWEGVASGGRQRWWYQWSISPMFVVLNPFAILEVRSIA